MATAILRNLELTFYVIARCHYFSKLSIAFLILYSLAAGEWLEAKDPANSKTNVPIGICFYIISKKDGR
jgi:hypothetical protein